MWLRHLSSGLWGLGRPDASTRAEAMLAPSPARDWLLRQEARWAALSLASQGPGPQTSSPGTRSPHLPCLHWTCKERLQRYSQRSPPDQRAKPNATYPHHTSWSRLCEPLGSLSQQKAQGIPGLGPGKGARAWCRHSHSDVSKASCVTGSEGTARAGPGSL